MSRLAILGAGGHGRVVADCAEAVGWKEIALFDDYAVDQSTSPWGLQGTSADLLAQLPGFDGIVIGIGANKSRLTWQMRLRDAGAIFPILIHPRAIVSSRAEVGLGSVVFAGAVVNVGARLAAAVIVNTGAIVDHDCRLGNGVHVSPGANLAGGVQVGDLSWIGIGATLRQGVTIGREAIVGAGAVVVRPVDDECVVIGNPARPM